MSQTVVGNIAVELGMSTDEFQRALAFAQAQAQQAANKVQSSINNATKGPGGSGGGGGGQSGFSGFALNFSRAMDDVQYGFRGVINNMELMGMTAAQSFGLSAKSAVAFGSALTLTAIAINNVISDIEKLLDTRTSWEKMADGPTSFAGSIAFASERMKELYKQTEDLSKKDATQGFRAVVSRYAKDIADMNDEYGTGGETLFSKLIRRLGPQTMQDQIQQNRITGEQIARNRIDLGIESVKSGIDQESFNAGLKMIGTQRAGEREIGEEYKKAFAMAADGAAESIRDQLFKQNVAAGMGSVEAEQQAIKSIGEASIGVKEAFDSLASRLPELDLGGKLEDVYESEAMVNREAFIDQQAKERESLQKQAENAKDRLDALQAQRMRSEIVGSADVFARNLNAGTSEFDPIVKAIEKQTEEYKQIMDRIAVLN
jgi:hypothetical protein